MLNLVLPKGSLEKATMELFEAADLPVERSSSVAYKASINDPRIASVRILRPQEIPTYVAEGLFDLGITGRDWIEETSSQVESLGELKYSKATAKPVRIVMAVPEDSPWQTIADLPAGVKVSTNIPRSRSATSRLPASTPTSVSRTAPPKQGSRHRRRRGRHHRDRPGPQGRRPRIIETLVTSYTELVANPASFADPEKAHAMRQIHTLLQGVLDARGKVLVKMNVSADALDEVIEIVPSLKSPTVNELFRGAGYAVETVVPKDEINILIPQLRDKGATDIVELPISKIIP